MQNKCQKSPSELIMFHFLLLKIHQTKGTGKMKIKIHQVYFSVRNVFKLEECKIFQIHFPFMMFILKHSHNFQFYIKVTKLNT